jgi:hypothetical protein
MNIIGAFCWFSILGFLLLAALGTITFGWALGLSVVAFVIGLFLIVADS